jgi:hypothetical protein
LGTTAEGVSGTLYLFPIYIALGCTISNINFVSGSTAESGGSHLWFALYDDGRAAPTGKLALLGQTADQTGAAAFAANTNLGLSLLTPYTTLYGGIYHVGFQCVATGMPALTCLNRGSVAAIQIASSTGAFVGGGIVSGVSSGNAPNPSGTTSAAFGFTYYAYLS